MNYNNKRLFSNTLYLYLLTFSRMLLPFFTLPYITRVFSTELYGVLVYIKSIVTYIILFVDFGFLLSATRRIALASNDKRQLGEIIGDTIAEKIVLSLCALLVFSILIYVHPILKSYKLLNILYFFATVTNIFGCDFLFRGLEKMRIIAALTLTIKLVIILLTFTFIVSDKNYLLIPIFEIIGNMLIAIYSLSYIKSMNIIVTITSMQKWISDIRESSVFFLSNLATTSLGALTTIICGCYLNITDVAYWGICMQLLALAKSLYAPIGNSLFPYMVKEKNIKLIRILSFIMVCPIMICSFIVFHHSKLIISILFGHKYCEAGNVLRILLPAFAMSFFSMLYGWPVLGALGKIKETTITTIIASVIQITTIFILILTKYINLYSMAISCCLAETSLFIARYCVYKFEIKLK